MPSFAKFYLESKFCYNLSENRILEILKGIKTNIPQSSLNLWMHQIIEMLLRGEEVDASFLPCDYVRHFDDGTDAEMRKTSQVVA